MAHRFVLLFSLVLASCWHESDGLSIQTMKASPVRIDDIITDYSFIPFMESDSVVANIMRIKSYNDRIFLFDESDLSIYVLQCDDGKTVLRKLSAKGRAKYEYLDISSFAFLDQTNEIVLYDRYARMLKMYSCDSLDFQRSVPVSNYINAMEVLDSNHLLVVKEKDGESKAQLATLSLSDGTLNQVMPLREDQADLMLDIALVNNGINDVSVCVPGYPNQIVSISNNHGLFPIIDICFTDSVFDRKYWRGGFGKRKEEYLLNSLASNKNDRCASVLPSLFLQKGKDYAFWFVSGEKIYKHNLPKMNLCVVRNGEPKVFSSILLADDSVVIQPVGIVHGKYACYFDLDELKEDKLDAPHSELQKALLQQKRIGTKSIVLLFNVL